MSNKFYDFTAPSSNKKTIKQLSIISNATIVNSYIYLLIFFTCLVIFVLKDYLKVISSHHNCQLDYPFLKRSHCQPTLLPLQLFSHHRTTSAKRETISYPHNILGLKYNSQKNKNSTITESLMLEKMDSHRKKQALILLFVLQKLFLVQRRPQSTVRYYRKIPIIIRVKWET